MSERHDSPSTSGTSSVTALLFRPVVDLGFAYGTLLTFLYGILIFCIGLLQLGEL